jgi:hypothetical protein
MDPRPEGNSPRVGARGAGWAEMKRTVMAAGAGLLLALAGGCASGPLLDNPLPVNAAFFEAPEPNPIYVPLGPESYRKVFECALQVLSDFGFDIRDANRYDGHIETVPRVAPGLGLFFRPGSPDCYERLLASLQSYRHRVFVKIDPANGGGYFIQVTAYKELEDLPRPVRALAGAAVFRYDNNVERVYEVVDPTVYESTWIPKGRDVPLEQALLRRIQSCL